MAIEVIEYTVKTNAGADLVSQLLGQAWTVNKLRARCKIEPLEGQHRYRFELLGSIFDAMITSDAGGTTLATHVHRTKVSQDKLMLVIPLGAKRVSVNHIQRDVVEKKTCGYLRDKGFSVSLKTTTKTL